MNFLEISTIESSMDDGGMVRPLDVKARLRALRRVYGFSSQEAFAKYIGIGVDAYQTAEGTGNLSKEIAFKINAKYGLPLEWLWFGRGMLPPHLDAALREHPPRNNDKPRLRRR